ncbi:MAG: radical SAM protein, partial [Methanomicrobiales archaeon]|nr:radical SAM protein [Methanomicrobiales archaeon]
TLASRPHLDSITLAGSGEPTLARSLGEVISWIRHTYPEYTVSVLTNGSLLTDSGVRGELLPANRVIPTLTTVFQPTFECIHHPHPSLRIDAIIGGMAHFRKEYTGSLWLEVFVVPGVNTSDTELAGLKAAIERIDPDRIQLNTLDRPAADPGVLAATDEELDRVRDLLGVDQTDIVGRHHPITPRTRETTDAARLVRATLSRRPSTIEDLVAGTGLSGGEVAKILGILEQDGVITSQRGARGIFYIFNQDRDDKETS